MKLRKFSFLATHIIIFSSLLLGYINCSTNSAEEGPAASSTLELGSGTCEDQLMQFFGNGYHKFLTQSCSSCHAMGPGKGQFANSDLSVAYKDFMQVGYTKVSSNAISDGHNPPYSGSQNTQTINELKITWIQALAERDKCAGVAGSVDSLLTLNERSHFALVKKAIPSMNDNEEQRIEFDLNSELSSLGADPVPSLPGAKMSVMIRKNLKGTLRYYTVYSPRLFGSQQDLKMKGMFTKINGRFVQASNNFTLVDTVIPKNIIESSTSALVSTGALIIPGVISADDMVSFNFEIIAATIIPPPPPPVTLAITSAKAQLANSSGLVSINVSLAQATTEPVSVTISADSTPICGSTSATATVTASSCLPEVYNLICPLGSTCSADAPVMATARSVVGATYNRFDWDYKFSTSSLIFAAGETTKTIQIQTSKDIRYETNRLLTLKLEKGIGNVQMGPSLAYIVFNKKINPIPATTEVTYTKLMNPQTGKLALNCLNCHNSNPSEQQGGFDISNYELMVANGVLKPGLDFKTVSTAGVTTKTYASKLFKRMNSQDPDAGQYITPMPRDKYLDYDTDISYVEKWILNGAPNN